MWTLYNRFAPFPLPLSSSSLLQNRMDPGQCTNHCSRVVVSNGRAQDGWTPLHVAADSGHVDAVSYLLSHNANLCLKDTVRLSANPLNVLFPPPPPN
jgi:ankyrin repeat protein